MYYFLHNINEINHPYINYQIKLPKTKSFQGLNFLRCTKILSQRHIFLFIYLVIFTM